MSKYGPLISYPSSVMTFLSSNSIRSIRGPWRAGSSNYGFTGKHWRLYQTRRNGLGCVSQMSVLVRQQWYECVI